VPAFTLFSSIIRTACIYNAFALHSTVTGEADMIESTLTDRFQTTIPKGVRESLGLRRGDRLAYLLEGGRVLIMKADIAEELDDPALGPFLDLIERDLRDRPQAIRLVTDTYVAELRELIAGVDVDLDAPLEDQA
jgi:antitoxin PrlF